VAVDELGLSETASIGDGGRERDLQARDEVLVRGLGADLNKCLVVSLHT
jgi:hypothetical protein